MMEDQPTQLRNFRINAGESVDINVGWQIKGVRVDNNTSEWYILSPQGYVIPPATLAWTTDLPQSASTINLKPTVYSGQPNFVFSGDVLNVTVFSDPIGISGGYAAIPNDQRSSIFSAAPGATLSTGTLQFPAIGCRIDNNTGTWYQIGATGILVAPYTTGFTIDLLPAITALTLSPNTAPYPPANTTGGTAIVCTLYASKIGNYGGTTATLGNSSGSLVSTASATVGAVLSITVNFTAAIAGQVICVSAAERSGGASGITTDIAGYTTLFKSAAVAANTGYLGWKIAAGGENSVTVNFSGGAATSGVAAVAVYGSFPISIFQTNVNAAANSSTVTPTTSPNRLIGLSTYAAAAVGTVVSSNTVIDVKVGDGTNNGAAIGSLPYTTVAAETATYVWSGTLALATAVIAGE
jgi:hypothetical protein